MASVAIAVPLPAAPASAHRKLDDHATGKLLYAPVVVTLANRLDLKARKAFNPAPEKLSLLHRGLLGGHRHPIEPIRRHPAVLNAARRVLSVAVPAGPQLIRASFTARLPILRRAMPIWRCGSISMASGTTCT